MEKIDETSEVVEHIELGGGYRRLTVRALQLAASLTPGQFVHVRVPTLESSALRRPFSVFDAENDRVTLLYKTVGRGTAALNAVQVGDALSVLGPLGHGFPLQCGGRPLLVGGGFGVAPLHFLAKRLRSRGGETPILFLGGRSQADLLAVEEFRQLGVEVHLATNDGSAGVRGLVTDPLDDMLIEIRSRGEKFELFACGPDGMLKAITQRAVGTGARGWISMDRHMVCGVGACYACIQKTVRGNSRCCVEGPVFAAADLVFD